MDKVIEFINGFKDCGPQYIQFTFYRGYCYWFAFILAARFNGEIWFNPDIVHFATKIGGNLYDIYGVVNIGQNPITGQDESINWMSWETFQRTRHEVAEEIIQSCIKKV